MDYKELIIDIEQTPVDKKGVAKNINRLLKHAKYLEGRKGINDPFAKGLLDTVPAFIRRQIERLELHLSDDVDIIAWISRNLMELFFTLRYMYSSQERYDEVIGEQLEAVVILPAHLHCVWTLPSGDMDFSTRWSLIKGYFIPCHRKRRAHFAKRA